MADLLRNNPAAVVIGAEGIDTRLAILQNVRTIVNTRKGSVPLNRDFGVSWMLVDLPVNEVLGELIMEISEQVATYEPRARVTRCTFDSDPSGAGEGRLRPRVQVEIVA